MYGLDPVDKMVGDIQGTVGFIQKLLFSKTSIVAAIILIGAFVGLGMVLR